ncbi:MAG: VWA domain-containing protein [Saprospiraceae bacterium]|nr:VWA domain-containing protein [Saprospiraceae bacterium]MBP7699423.1 VWA domain-containing protein [Saprospiraceae bacterium]
MDWFTNFRFLHSGWLMLLPIVPLMWWWVEKKSKKPVNSFKVATSEDFQSKNTTWRTQSLPFINILKYIALSLLIIAMARPQRILQSSTMEADGIDVGLVMDVSNSMLAQDFLPNRLEVCKDVAIEFIDKRIYDRFALIVFSGEAFTQCPITADHAVLKELIDKLECGFLEDGTAIGMGLATGVNRLKDSKAKSKIIILLTDGIDNVISSYVKPLQAANIANELGIKVYTIGVGGIGEALAPIGRRSDGRYFYGLTKVEIDESLLQQIAEVTNAKYFRATDKTALKEIYNEIDKLEKTTVDVQAFMRYNELFFGFVCCSILLLVLELILKVTVFDILNKNI